jgi:subtilisin family serine protease
MKPLASALAILAFLGTATYAQPPVSSLAAPHGGVFRRAEGKYPLKGRYIVTLADDTRAQDVNGLARALTAMHGGRLLGVTTHAIRAFGVSLAEGAALALVRNPHVKMVEEDEVMLLSNESPFDFRRVIEPQAYNSCPWAGSYYLCEYANDLYWHLDRLDNSHLIYGYKAYGYNSYGGNVRAYVIDTGVYAAHQEFDPGQVAAGANMMMDPDIADTIQRPDEEGPVQLDASAPTNPCGGWTNDFVIGHGTAVASVLGGRTAGVAKGVTIVPVKVFSCPSYLAGQRAIPKLAVVRGLDWVRADMSGRSGRAVVNMSTYVPLDADFDGPEPGPTEEFQVCEDGAGGYVRCVGALESVINNLIAGNPAVSTDDIPVVVSANNQDNGNCRTSPARMGYGNEAGFVSPYRTITVGGTMFTAGYTDRRWECVLAPEGCEAMWSNPITREGMGSNFGPCVSIWAPAWNIRTAHSQSASSYRPTGGASSGTSFAAPYVAGAVARLLQAYPNLSSQEVWNALVTRANQRGTMPADFDPSPVFNNRLVYMPAVE